MGNTYEEDLEEYEAHCKEMATYRQREYAELAPEKKIIVDAYAKEFPEVFKDIMSGTIVNSDFSEHEIRYEGFKAGWKAGREQK